MKKTYPSELVLRSLRRTKTRQALEADGFIRVNYTNADDENNYQETWVRDGAKVTIEWTTERVQ